MQLRYYYFAIFAKMYLQRYATIKLNMRTIFTSIKIIRSTFSITQITNDTFIAKLAKYRSQR